MDLTAKQRSLIATTKAVSSANLAQADAEKTARSTPVTGTVTGYDEVTGDWLVETPDGGTLRTQSLSNASLAGKRLPIQRFSDSQTSTVNTPPTDADSSWVVNEIEALQRDVVALGAVQLQDRDPDGAADARYNGDKWLNTLEDSLFVWVQETETWRAIGGSGGGVSLSRTVCTFYIDSIPNNTSSHNAIFDALQVDELGIFTQGATELGPLASGQYLISVQVNLPRRSTTNGYINFNAALFVAGVRRDYLVDGSPYMLVSPGPLEHTWVYEANASALTNRNATVLVTGHMTVDAASSTIRCQYQQENGLGTSLSADSCVISVIKLS